MRPSDPGITEALSKTKEIPALFDGLTKLRALVTTDPESGLMRVRKLLEFVIHDLYKRRFHEPPGTRPLENLVQRMIREDYLSKKQAIAITLIRELGNLGVHSQQEVATSADVEMALAQFLPILSWYLAEVGPTLSTEAQPPQPVIADGEVTSNRSQWRSIGIVSFVICFMLVGSVGYWIITRKSPESPRFVNPEKSRPEFIDTPVSKEPALASAPILKLLGGAEQLRLAGGQDARLSLRIAARRGGNSSPQAIQNGDRLTSADSYFLELQGETSGFLYVFQIDSTGKLTVLYPRIVGASFSSGENPIVNGASVRIPPSNQNQDLRLDENLGVEHVYCILARDRWEELERTLGEVESRGGAAAKVAGPFGPVALRGVGQLVPSEPGSTTGVNSVGTDRYVGKSGLIVVCRWFTHDPRR